MKLKIEHDMSPCKQQRVEKILRELDGILLPKLSERVNVEAYAKKLAAYAELYYVVEGGRDIANAAVYMNQGKQCFLSSFGVLTEYQRKGAGRKLMQEIVREAGSRGFTEIRLQVLEANQKAVDFYRSRGFSAEEKAGEWIEMRYCISHQPTETT